MLPVGVENVCLDWSLPLADRGFEVISMSMTSDHEQIASETHELKEEILKKKSAVIDGKKLILTMELPLIYLLALGNFL